MNAYLPATTVGNVYVPAEGATTVSESVVSTDVEVPVTVTVWSVQVDALATYIVTDSVLAPAEWTIGQ